VESIVAEPPSKLSRQESVEAEPIWNFPLATETELKPRTVVREAPRVDTVKEPSSGWSEADIAVPEAPAHSHAMSWDLKIQYQPELQVMRRTSRVLAGAQITIREAVKTETHDGRKVICIALNNPNRKVQARELLRLAGIPLEF
jgi:hypothetical protein